MEKHEFDSKMSRLVTEKKLLDTSLMRAKDEETRVEIKRRIIHLKSEMQMLKKEYNQSIGIKNGT